MQAYAVEPLPPSALLPSLVDQNIVDRDASRARLRRVVERGVTPARVALVIPDVAAKVSLVRFDQTPTRATISIS